MYFRVKFKIDYNNIVVHIKWKTLEIILVTGVPRLEFDPFIYFAFFLVIDFTEYY